MSIEGIYSPPPHVFHFLASLSLFPHLVAGPIVRASDMLPQLAHTPHTTPQQRFDGLILIVHGYFKKVVVADTLAPLVDKAFGVSQVTQSGAYWWAAALMFAFQIYCDFSGYSDIARGLAKGMGYNFPLNFDHPYTATSLREFWERWHISLSTWFRDYVYIPLGGSRRGAVRAHVNMWATMLISGLWHGAAWTFIIWGALHASYLSIERWTNWPGRLRQWPGGRILAALIVFGLVLIAWVFFRAQSLAQAVEITRFMIDPRLFHFSYWADAMEGSAPIIIASMILREAYFFFGWNQSNLMQSRFHDMLKPVTLAIVLAACIFFRGPGRAFIYFQF